MTCAESSIRPSYDGEACFEHHETQLYVVARRPIQLASRPALNNNQANGITL